MNWHLCPRKHKESLYNYYVHGIDPGGFLQAVLENDLINAIAYADEDNRKYENLINLYSFLHNEFPLSCYKSKEAVRKWMSHRGLEGVV